ncbi:Uma2 family endonuclease [Nocardiopsis sp. EMB25]|uniref:Uma2 family endonuclease n=1 Tax=Nocardiopsis sp. EMB25 TaxID=2835867 RepID=UPI0022849FFC|nr:Uma2 family endonuclease [Nocardiopsis sp. EMB25]MCY9783688.1 Uma2 family endonuclease [Nocardiopsis sp. EMB25]
MTVTEHHPPPEAPPLPISPELFEEIARLAGREENAKLEYINGKVWVEPVTDSDHAAILSWMFRQFIAHRPDLDMPIGQGLKIGTYRHGRALPDGVLVPVGHFNGQGDYPDPDGVLAVVEVTSWDADTHARDRVEKPAAYAATGIGVYLLVDRDANTVVVHSRPVNGRYMDRSEHPYGETVQVPGLGVILDTDALKRFAR